MSLNKSRQEKSKLHPRNKNRERYDLEAMTNSNPALAEFVQPNEYGNASIDFSNPMAVKSLNKALLKHYYGIRYWDFPDDNLCPPIPGRADYIHYIADLLSENNAGKIPIGTQITCIDVGVGANCIYPIIGVTEYGWQFIGSDIDPKSIESASKIVKMNESLKGKIECKLQKNANDIFSGIIAEHEKFDVSICNPPFHKSAEAAEKGSRRKVKNLTGMKQNSPTLNFAGISRELIYPGGEFAFISNMIRESNAFSKNCLWFTTLVSKQSNLNGILKMLAKSKAKKVKTIPMGTGNKTSRIVAWSFFTEEEQRQWRKSRWKK